MKLGSYYVNERTGVVHRGRECARGLVRYTLYGDEEGCFQWLYVPGRPGHNPRMLTEWRECGRCFPPIPDLIGPSVARVVTPHREDDDRPARAPVAGEDLPARSELFGSSGASFSVSTGRGADVRAKRRLRVEGGSDGLAVRGVEVRDVHERRAEALGVLVQPLAAAPVAELVLGEPGGVEVRAPSFEAERPGDVAGLRLAHWTADGAWPLERDERELRHRGEG